MPDYHDSPFDLAGKVSSLTAAKEEKLTRLSPAPEPELTYEPATLTSMNDVDSLGFDGVTGGVGRGIDPLTGENYDKTGRRSLDRNPTIDSYEVFPKSRDALLSHSTNRNRVEQLEKQRRSLAMEKGVPVDEITNEDVYQRGGTDAYKTMILAGAHGTGDQEYIDSTRKWLDALPEEATEMFRTENPNMNTLNIPMERAFTGEYDYYGRPVAQPRFLGSEERVGESVGYKYDDAGTQEGSTFNPEAFSQRFLNRAVEDASFGDRLGNAVDAFQKTMYKEVGLDLADFIGEGLNSVTGGAIGWDVGTEEEKTALASEISGYKAYLAADDYKQAEEHATNIVDALRDENKSVDAHDVYSLVKIGLTTPEMLGDSLGFVASMFVPILGWGGKAAKAGKAINKVKAAQKAGKITDEAAEMAIREHKANVHVLNKMQTFTQKNAGLLQMSAGNVNDQIDAYKLEHGEGPSIFKVGQMFATESLLLGLDRWADVSILKSPAALKGARDAFTVLAPEGKAKVLAKTVAVAGGLAANMGKEAAQEYVQEIGQEFNVKFNFDDNDTFVSAVNEAGEVLLDRDMQIAGVTGAGLGAGGAVQFEALGTAGSLPAQAVASLSKAGGKLGEGIKAAKPAEAQIQDTAVEEDVIAPEQAQTNRTTANSQADSIVSKYSSMVGDEEALALFEAEGTAQEESVDTPTLRDNLRADPTGYSSAYEELERAEAVISSREGSADAKDTDELSLKVLRKAKRELLTSLMQEEEAPTLGSGITPTDIVEDYLETVGVKDGELDISVEELATLEAYAKDNDIPKFRFEALKSARTTGKDAYSVFGESITTGDRSATAYRNKLKRLVNTPNPSKKEIAKTIDDVDRFLVSQETRKSAFDAVLNEVEANVTNYNEKIAAKKSIPAAVKASFKGQHKIPGYDGAYVFVSEGSDGKLYISRATRDISKSMQDTIDYLGRIKTRYAGKVENILGTKPTSSVDGVSVRPNAKYQDQREQDRAFFERVGVTKAIVDENKASPVWSTKGDYRKDNESIVNTGEYTADDVVLIDSSSKGFVTKDKLVKEVVKARDAGATIIVDKASAGNTSLTKLLQRYHFKKVKDTDGVSKFMVADKAQPLREAEAAEKATKRTKNKVLNTLLRAFAAEAATESGNMKEALDEGEIDQKAYDSYQKAIEAAKEYFPKGKTAMRAFYDSGFKKQSDKVYDALLEVATAHGLESKDLSGAMTEARDGAPEGSMLHLATIDAIARVDAKVLELSAGQEKVAEWRAVQELAKRGKEDLDAWIENNIDSPKGIVETVIETSIGKGRKSAYVTYNSRGNDFDPPTTDVKKLRKSKDGEVLPYQVIEQDPSKYLTVGRVTFLNSLPVEQLRIAGPEGIGFNQILDTALNTFKETINDPQLKQGSSNNSILPFTNSPVSSLVFDKDMNVNENVVVAMELGLNTFIKNSAYLMTKGKKSREDIAEILGMDVSQVSREAVDLMNDKGMLYKTVANSVGKEIAGELGLQAKSDSEADAQAYDALVADMGQTAILMGVKKGILKIDNSLPANEFAKTVLGKNVDPGYSSDNGPKVLFVQAAKGKEERLKTIAEQTQTLVDLIPGMDVSRKEPSLKPLTKKQKEMAVSKIRKEKLGLEIPENSKKALTELMDTEWTADLKMMKEMLDSQEHIMKHLGYLEIDSSEYNVLSFEEKAVQEAVNRGVERSFEEMRWLVEHNEGVDSVSMWFEYFFSKNGRFFIDSNTINPQTEKHLHRFTTQPASHANKYSFSTNKKGAPRFKIGNKDVTFLVQYALAQGFGFATDKKSTKDIADFTSAVMNKLKTPKAVAAAKKEFIENGKYKISEDKEIKIEHFGHALQAFDFMEKLRAAGKTGTFTSAITAEFDAVTSGFGLKALQLPIIKDRDDWLRRVGVVMEDDPLLTSEDVKSKSMNDLLSDGNVRDSYQTLANDVRFSADPVESFQAMLANKGEKGSILDNRPFDQNLWEALIEVLPKVEGDTIKSELRNLFKYPFMTFNYSASIKSIRKNLLTGDMLSALAKQMAKVDLKSKEEKDLKIIKLMKVFADKKISIAELQDQVRNKPLYSIKAGGKFSLEKYLGQMIEASYGAKVEEILTAQFKPFIDAQDKVNSAFNAMFQAFAIEFDKELIEARKKGAVTREKEKALYESLKDRWPMIKGPLSKMEKDGVGIYALETGSPYGPYSGRKPVRANLSPSMKKKLGQDDIRVSHMVKHLAAAVAAGSVVPIHYIDGAVMGETINGLARKGIQGITAIHDAIMPSLLHVEQAQEEYNKQVIKVNSEYSFIHEIAQTLERFHTTLDTSGEVYDTTKVTVKKDGADVTMSVRNFLKSTYGDFLGLANEVSEGRKRLFSKLDGGSRIMHMAGTEGGVYKVEPGTISYKPVEKMVPKEYTTRTKKTADGQTLSGLNDHSQNLCKGG